jgi:hypothetical protein
MSDYFHKKFLIELLVQIGVSTAKDLFKHVKPIKSLLVVYMPDCICKRSLIWLTCSRRFLHNICKASLNFIFVCITIQKDNC